MEICIDFDGTCVSHDYPRIGKDIGSIPVLKKIIESGNNIVLFTMRGDTDDSNNYLTDAVNWFKDNNIPLYGINVNPEQHSWTNSPKAYGQLYIDDAALGCPLIYNSEISNKPFVDWIKIEEMLILMKII